MSSDPFELHTGPSAALLPVELRLDLPPMDTPHGIRLRLKNLGYYRITEGQTEGAEIDAIKAFQRDQGLTPTGKLDDETRARLEAAHGH